MIIKKSAVNCMKYALAHGDYELYKRVQVPFFPPMSIKKTGYTLLRCLCTSEKAFNLLYKLYDKHLSKI